MMKRVLRWIGIIIGSLLGIIILLLIGIWVISANRLNRTYEVTADFSLNVPIDAASIAEGERLYSIMCVECHGENLAGMEFNDFLSGRLHAANLTAGAGGLGNNYSDEELARAVWYGVKADGSPTVVMPVELNRAVNVEDMENLIAYIRSVPPVDSDYPEIRPGPMLRVMHVTNIFPLVTAELVDLNAPPPGAIAAEDTLAYGEYRAVFCTACHGVDFAGNEFAGGPNITPHESATGTWTEADFAQAIRKGRRPDGTAISTDMPWESFSLYTDEEVHAIWTYLQSVAPVARE
jgi:mono/diheme cytochrome c family protein